MHPDDPRPLNGKSVTIFGPMTERAYAKGRLFISKGYSSDTHAADAIRQGIITKPGQYVVKTGGELALVTVTERTALVVADK